MKDEVRKKIDRKEALVGVIGLGYVGLPLIKAFIDGGFQTIGFDVDASKVEILMAGKSYIKHLPDEWIAGCISDNSFMPTADLSKMAEADASRPTLIADALRCSFYPFNQPLTWLRGGWVTHISRVFMTGYARTVWRTLRTISKLTKSPKVILRCERRTRQAPPKLLLCRAHHLKRLLSSTAKRARRASRAVGCHVSPSRTPRANKA